LFASISRWVGNRIKGRYIVGLWYLSCWTTLASNLRFATAPNHGLWAWQHHRLFLVVGLARWIARIIKIPVILQKTLYLSRNQLTFRPPLSINFTKSPQLFSKPMHSQTFLV
jgi:hypothetical protein